MSDVPLYRVITKMGREDFRPFLYEAVFLRNTVVIPVIILISAGGAAAATCFINNRFLANYFFVVWASFFLFSVITACLIIEWKNISAVKSEKTGIFSTSQSLDFFDQEIAVSNKFMPKVGIIRYDQFHLIMETKKYFILYINVNQAMLIRKKDIVSRDLAGFTSFLKQKFNGRYRISR